VTFRKNRIPIRLKEKVVQTICLTGGTGKARIIDKKMAPEEREKDCVLRELWEKGNASELCGCEQGKRTKWFR